MYYWGLTTCSVLQFVFRSKEKSCSFWLQRFLYQAGETKHIHEIIKKQWTGAGAEEYSRRSVREEGQSSASSSVLPSADWHFLWVRSVLASQHLHRYCPKAGFWGKFQITQYWVMTLLGLWKRSCIRQRNCWVLRGICILTSDTTLRKEWNYNGGV